MKDRRFNDAQTLKNLKNNINIKMFTTSSFTSTTSNILPDKVAARLEDLVSRINVRLDFLADRSDIEGCEICHKYQEIIMAMLNMNASSSAVPASAATTSAASTSAATTSAATTSTSTTSAATISSVPTSAANTTAVPTSAAVGAGTAYSATPQKKSSSDSDTLPSYPSSVGSPLHDPPPYSSATSFQAPVSQQSNTDELPVCNWTNNLISMIIESMRHLYPIEEGSILYESKWWKSDRDSDAHRDLDGCGTKMWWVCSSGEDRKRRKLRK